MDFEGLPADAQLLHLNIQDKVREAFEDTGRIANTPEDRERLVQAVLAAQTQTVEDCGGIRIDHDPETRLLTISVPRVAGWFTPEG